MRWKTETSEETLVEVGRLLRRQSYDGEASRPVYSCAGGLVG